MPYFWSKATSSSTSFMAELYWTPIALMVANALFWLVFWTFILLIALFPDLITDFIANILGFKSNINALIFLALGILFFMNFRLIQTINKLERKLTKLVRSKALDEADSKEPEK